MVPTQSAGVRDIHRSSVQLLEETTLDKEDKDRYARTFPPNTSSPIIRHAAVWMSPLPCVEVVPAAMTNDVIDELLGFAAETCAKLGRGRERCLTT